MSIYLRTSRNTGMTLPWWLAIPAGIVWLVVMTVVVLWTMTFWLVSAGVGAWHSWRDSR